jgi:hypothetical protein
MVSNTYLAAISQRSAKIHPFYGATLPFFDRRSFAGCFSAERRISGRIFEHV